MSKNERNWRLSDILCLGKTKKAFVFASQVKKKIKLKKKKIINKKCDAVF